jgi:hypothetical protein
MQESWSQPLVPPSVSRGEGFPKVTASLEELPGSFVVMFFRTKTGELRCRVTDVVTRETWIASSASSLWRMLVERQPADTGAQSPS